MALLENPRVTFEISSSSTETSPSPSPPNLYRPLDFINFEFRLLTILGTPGDSAEPEVCCKLEHAYLDDPPQYHALSYCWGDALVTVPIQVNGQTKQVTANLEAVLRELRNRKITTVWADALCINQQDPLERGMQVMRMGLIYSKAIKVLAWLGPEADDSAAAMKRLSDPVPPASILPAEKVAIQALFSRPYWKRVWIIQEVSKAQKFEVLCGSASLSWKYLKYADSRVAPPELLILDKFRATERRARLSDGRQNQRGNLYDAMIKTNSCASTDVRDKIYALLGLTVDGATLVPTPNYIRPAQSVYFQAFKEALSRTREFAYITRGEEHIPESNEEPDWTALTFGVAYWVLSLKKYHGGFPRSLPSQHNWDAWQKSRRSLSTPSPVFCMSGLHVSAWILDTIESIASVFPSFNRPYPPPLKAVHETRFRPSGRIPRSHPEMSLVLRNIWQALTVKLGPRTNFQKFDANGRISYAAFITKDHLAKLNDFRISFALITLFRGIDYDMMISKNGENARWCKEYSKESDLLKNWFQENRGLVYNQKRLEEWIQLYPGTEAYNHAHKAEWSFREQLIRLWIGSEGLLYDISHFLDEVNEAERHGRRLAASRKSVMTLVPRQTKVGDVICLLRGSDCPIILRPQGQAYVFINRMEDYPYCYDEHRMNLTTAYDRDWERLHII